MKKIEPKQSIWKWLLKNGLELLLIVVAVFAINRFILINAKIPSESMEPTIMVGNKIIGNRLAYLTEEPKRYDVIIFKYPDDPKILFIKRVIGLPGDKIEIRDGDVYVNDSAVPLDDSFCPEPDSTENGLITEPITVPEGCYFMLGDNRLHSKDSRYWNNTFVRKDQIVAKAWFRYWPINQMKWIR